MDEEQVLIVMTSGTDTPRRCATPFFMATLAAAMDYEVNMFFTIDGAQLLVKGAAEKVFPKEGGRAAGGYLQDALDAGVHFKACTASMELHDLKKEDLIDGVEMVGGASMWEMADEAKIVLSF
ncbi:MAG: DsrE/DsrF/DrsH-like family protein [Anaerolineales bacterium]|jgi:predicted peroxiredoxin